MTPHLKLHPDDEGIDHIELDVVPRFKTSGLSGNEWRVSARARFYRKGELVGERSMTSLEALVTALPWLWMTKPEWCEGPLFDAGRNGRCQQAGCPNPAVVTYELKEEYSARGEGPLPPSPLGRPRRAFCQPHAPRGDADLEDCDANYVLIAGPQPLLADVPPEAVSPSARVDVKVDKIEDAPDAIREAVRRFRQEEGGT